MSGITKRIRSASRHRSLGNAASLTGLDGLGDGSDSGSDIMSGHASEVSDPEDNNNAAPESPEKKRRPRGAKMVRGLSKAARRLRNRSIGSTEALTLGRVGVSSRRSNAIWLNDAGIDVPSPEHRSSSRQVCSGGEGRVGGGSGNRFGMCIDVQRKSAKLRRDLVRRVLPPKWRGSHTYRRCNFHRASVSNLDCVCPPTRALPTLI